ncbi:G2/M phase-specific E3 ubiquitin-protein ligase-like [Osmerus eperlanus]|uniref:G2/M phase-specific E3 ubiquitin-protein ligase-like n=1 Tax=Osmerus eperlanus TaxID=29151 RepID=UPI002E0D8CEA
MENSLERDMSFQLETLDPLEWQNAGTPDVFYKIPTSSAVDASQIVDRNDFMLAENNDDNDSSDHDSSGHDTNDENNFTTDEDLNLATVLKCFQKQHFCQDEEDSQSSSSDSGNELHVIVHRRKVLYSAFKAMSSPSFCWKKSPKVEFVGEEGADYGGPQREFFRLLMQDVQQSGVFEGPSKELLFTYHQGQEEKYLKVGKCVGWSIVHGGPGLRALDKTLFACMCGHNPSFRDFRWQNLDEDVQSKIKKILNCKDENEFAALLQPEVLGNWLAECGIYMSKREEIPNIIAYICKHYVFMRVANIIKQFTDGLNSLGNLWDVVKANYAAFLPVFTDMSSPLTRQSLKSLFSVNYSTRGTNRREQEEDTIFSWEVFLKMVEDSQADVTFEDIFIFITSADMIPPLGFQEQPTIEFYDQEQGRSRMPYASTCALTFYLPRGLDSEYRMKEMVTSAIKNSLGFGKP